MACSILQAVRQMLFGATLIVSLPKPVEPAVRQELLGALPGLHATC